MITNILTAVDVVAGLLSDTSFAVTFELMTGFIKLFDGTLCTEAAVSVDTAFT
jgi:hypothetical protein